MSMPRPMIHDSFDAYLEELAPKLGHADLVPSFKDYCSGMMLPLPRKSIEPLAASVDPENVTCRHATRCSTIRWRACTWSDRALLTGVAQWVLPLLLPGTKPFWIIDDTSFRKRDGISWASAASIVARFESRITARSPSVCRWPRSGPVCLWRGASICRNRGRTTRHFVAAPVSRRTRPLPPNRTSPCSRFARRWTPASSPGSCWRMPPTAR